MEEDDKLDSRNVTPQSNARTDGFIVIVNPTVIISLTFYMTQPYNQENVLNRIEISLPPPHNPTVSFHRKSIFSGVLKSNGVPLTSMKSPVGIASPSTSITFDESTCK